MASWNVFQRSEILCLCKNLYRNVHGSFFIIYQKWEQPSCPLKGSINHGMLHRNSKGGKYQYIHVNWISNLKQQYLISKG